MKERCPSAAFVCRARLPNYELAFTRKAKGRWKPYGVADIVEARAKHVWGVVYQINEVHVGALDLSEGYVPGRMTNAYQRTELHVEKEGNTKESLAVTTYVVCSKEDTRPLPHRDYIELILQGAKHWHLPHTYVAALQQIESAQ